MIHNEIKNVINSTIISYVFSTIPTYAQTPIVLQINNTIMTVNGIEKEIDSEPIIINNHTLLPH